MIDIIARPNASHATLPSMRLLSSSFFSLARTTTPGARPPDNAAALHRLSQRHIVTPKVLSALVHLPWFAAVFDCYAFQPFAQCEDHSEALQEQLIKGLHGQDLIELMPPGTETNPRAIEFLTEKDPSADRIAELAQAHGPLAVTLAHALGPGQGQRLYDKQHAMVILFTFLHEGRPIAVATDGSDLQQNAVMDWVHAYADRAGMTLDELTVSHRLEIQRELPRGMHVAQLCFRLIDLPSMIQASHRKNKSLNFVRWAANAQLKLSPLPPHVEEVLQALCRRSPEIVERFDDFHASRIDRDE